MKKQIISLIIFLTITQNYAMSDHRKPQICQLPQRWIDKFLKGKVTIEYHYYRASKEFPHSEIRKLKNGVLDRCEFKYHNNKDYFAFLIFNELMEEFRDCLEQQNNQNIPRKNDYYFNPYGGLYD